MNTSLDDEFESDADKERQPFSATNLPRPTEFAFARMQARNATKINFKTDTGGRDLKPKFSASQISSPTNLAGLGHNRSRISKRVINVVSSSLVQASSLVRRQLDTSIQKRSIEKGLGA